MNECKKEMSKILDSGNESNNGFTDLAQDSLIAHLREARVEAGITCKDAAIKLGIPVEIMDDVEAGKLQLSLSEIRGYAYAVGAVIEYSVSQKKYCGA